MEKNKRALGFYIALVSCALAIVSAICYGVEFSKITYKEQVFDVSICILLAVIGVAAAVMLFVDKRIADFAPAVLCLGSGISIMMFIKMVVWPISDTIYGIEPFPEINQLITCAVLIVATWLTAEIALYAKKFRS